MNIDTGEIISFGDEAERKEFFSTAQLKSYVPVKNKHLTQKEFSEKIVDNKEVKELLIDISKAKDLPRGVRRRLEKKLYKLRKKDNHV